jgi:serine/threonine-protein kinase
MRWALALLIAMAPATSRAQEDVALAESLYRDGQRLAREGNCPQARQKFVASLQIDRASGPLLGLGGCYEKEGKTASAWASYTDAASVAQARGRDEHERAARERLKALEGRLCRARIDLMAPLPEITIVLDGQLRPRELAGTPLPLDPGEHRLEVGAPGRRPWRQLFTLRTEGKTEVIVVPALEAAPDGRVDLLPPTELRARPEETLPLALAPAPADTGVARPLHKRPWFWVVAGAAAVGLAVAIAGAAGAFTSQEDAACPPMITCR